MTRGSSTPEPKLPARSERRPFYLVGHNTNSIAEIREGLARGLNAFEIDVNKDERNELYVSHGSVSTSPILPLEPPPRLEPFLTELKAIVESPEGAGLALVIFDCKIVEAELGRRLLKAVRTHLTDQGKTLSVIFSVPSLASARTFFELIAEGLTPREALMIDEEDDPEAVARFFAERNVERGAYGNGITTAVGLGLPSPTLVAQMDAAVALMALGRLCFVYPWVLVAASTMREFMRAGVSGVMVDVAAAETLARTLAEPEFATSLRRATRDDDTFEACAALVLEVATADTTLAGTNAIVTFALETTDGRVLSRSVDAGLNARFERGGISYVTLPSGGVEPGQIRSIRIEHDGSGLGPDWRVESVTVRARGRAAERVRFDCEITRDRAETRSGPGR